MSDLKIDARLKEINIKIRAMEGEYTKRKLESANGLNEELHAIDNKFHEELRNLKENYMRDRQAIEDRYFADKKSIDKEYEDKRLDLIDSIKEVIGDISEVVGFEPVKTEEPISRFESVNNDYTSIFDNSSNDVLDANPVNQTPLTSIDDIEESLGEVTNGFGPLEPVVEDINIPLVNDFNVVSEAPIVNDFSIPESTIENEVINQNVIDEPAVSTLVQTEPVVTNTVIEASPATVSQVQILEEVPVTPVYEQPVSMEVPVMPTVDSAVPTENVVPSPAMVQPVAIEQVVPAVTTPVYEQPIPAQNVVQDINASIDNALDDINPGVN